MSKKLTASDWRLIWLTLGLGLTLWLLGFLGLVRPLTDRITHTYQPIQRVVIGAVIQLKIQYLQLGEIWRAEQALVELRREYISLMEETVELRAIRSENLALRKMIENTDRKLVKTKVTAPIISFAQPALGIGRDDGLSQGMMIISQNHLLGFISEVGSNQALVTLLNHPKSQPVLAETAAGVRGLVRGDGRQIWLLEVPPDKIVTAGEIVVATGQAGVTPKLILGLVSQVEVDSVAATQKILLTQPISFYELPLVEVR